MADLTGQSIGRYHILEQLGEGGMATVYKAYDTRLERNVALKVLRTELFSPILLDQVLQRFEREAKSLAKLSHPNIVNILDFGEHEDMPYLIMEYLPGGTLKQKLGHAIPWHDAIRMILPVANGLSFAHQNGIIHRDVKPSNILLQSTKSAVLTDFGIAKLLEGVEGQTLTGSGVGIGTPEYMAPEQGVGAHTTDARADVYSLGIVLYEMITGRKPYVADTPMAVVLKQMTDPLPRPATFVPDLPENVEQILLKALAKEPEDRYQNMDELINALETATRESRTILSAEPEKTHHSAPIPAPTKIAVSSTKTAPASDKRKTSLGRWALIAIIIVGFAAVGFWAGLNLINKPSQPAPPPLDTSTPEQIVEPTQAPPVEPTERPAPRPTNTSRPPSLPGEVVIPIENMVPEIPWLPLDSDAAPGATWIGFKVNEPPFDNILVRRALAAALDRQFLADIARENSTTAIFRPATSFLPPQTLGRDLYGQVGVPYDPEFAAALLAEAGYPGGNSFPTITLFVNRSDINTALYNTVQQMWMDVLNIQVEVEYVEWQVYLDTINSDTPPFFRFGWRADFNDPENFMNLFRSGADNNISDFASPEFNHLINQAIETTNPIERQELYIEAERILCEENVVIIPLYNFTVPVE